MHYISRKNKIYEHFKNLDRYLKPRSDQANISDCVVFAISDLFELVGSSDFSDELIKKTIKSNRSNFKSSSRDYRWYQLFSYSALFFLLSSHYNIGIAYSYTPIGA